MEFLQLVYFCSAAETENFSQSAQKFGVPSTGLSQSVRRLEKEVGVPLFDRVPNGIKLNDRGKDFYIKVKSSLDMLNDAKEAAREEKVTGQIKVLAITSKNMVMEAITKFKTENSNVSFVVDFEPKGNIDTYNIIITDNMRYTTSWKWWGLLDDELMLAVHKDHPLAQSIGEKVCNDDISAMKDESFICYDDSSGLTTMIKQICEKGHFIPSVGVRVNDPHALVTCLEANIGITVIPYFEFKDILSEDIVLKPFEQKTYKQIVIGYNKQRYLSRAAGSFLSVMEEIAKEYKTE